MKKRMNIHLFRTCGYHYVYDVPKNMILKISKKTYGLLKQVETGEVEYEKLMEDSTVSELIQNGYLSFQYIETIKHPMTNNLEQIMDGNLHMLTLQVTQNCNLRCKYCVYSGSYINRQHNNKRMSFETAKKAIDYYITHSTQSPKLRFGFYGGEPTLEMDLIRKCVGYIRQQAPDRLVEFNLTTNATILNKEFMQFFADNNFFLTISLDGSKEIQDKNRVYAESGKGTFDKVIGNIRWIRKEFPEYLDNIHFNMVMDPADGYTASNLFFLTDESVKGIYVNATEKNDFNYKDKYIKTSNYYSNRSYEQFKAIANYYRNFPEDISPLVEGYLVTIKKNIADVLKPDETNFSEGHPGGPCVPGLQRLFVNADGNLYPCERVNETSEIMKIGTLDDGIDLEKVKYLLNVGKVTEDACKKCWAFRFCTACAVYADEGDYLSAEKRMNRCADIRSSVASYFKEYCILKGLKMDFEELMEDRDR